MRAGKSGQIQWEECRVATSLTVTVGHKSLTDRSTVLVRRRDKLWKNIHNNLMPNSSSSSILFCGSKNQKLHAHHSRMETFSYSLIGLYMCFSLCTCPWSVDRISVQSGGMEKAGRQTGNLECMKNSIACMALVRNSSSSFFFTFFSLISFDTLTPVAQLMRLWCYLETHDALFSLWTGQSRKWEGKRQQP